MNIYMKLAGLEFDICLCFGCWVNGVIGVSWLNGTQMGSYRRHVKTRASSSLRPKGVGHPRLKNLDLWQLLRCFRLAQEWLALPRRTYNEAHLVLLARFPRK
jgi:hypothetical protein